MNIIKITPQAAEAIQAIRDAGKTPWVIVNEDYLVGSFDGRTNARLVKTSCHYAGKILKADEVTFEVIDLAALADKVEESIQPVVAPKAPKVPVSHTGESTIERPCKTVWFIADEMIKANPSVKRKEVLAECVRRGIAFYTARTQYQQWLQVQKEMAEREAQQAAAK